MSKDRKINEERIEKAFCELKDYAKNVDGRFENIELTQEDAVLMLDLINEGRSPIDAMQEVLDGIIDILSW